MPAGDISNITGTIGQMAHDALFGDMMFAMLALVIILLLLALYYNIALLDAMIVFVMPVLFVFTWTGTLGAEFNYIAGLIYILIAAAFALALWKVLTSSGSGW